LARVCGIVALAFAAAGCQGPAMSGVIGGLAASSLIEATRRSPLPLASAAVGLVERHALEPIDAPALLAATTRALATDLGAPPPVAGDALVVPCGERRATIATTDANVATWIERLARAREAIQPCLGPGERADRTEYDYAVVARMVRVLGHGAAFFPELDDGKGRNGGGIGLELTQRDGGAVVVSAFDATPAARAGIRLLVLVDDTTAAGAEIIAGALRDHGATLGGSRTFGQGDVSTLFPLSERALLRLVTARAFTPSGTPIGGRGIEPQVVLEAPAAEDLGGPADAPLAWAVRAAAPTAGPLERAAGMVRWYGPTMTKETDPCAKP
jgi:hypothetical protein